MRRIILFVAVVALAGAVAAIVPAAGSAAPAAPAAAPISVDTRQVKIPARDGVLLDAWTVTPSTPGPHPLVMFVTAWDESAFAALIPATKLAAQGYQAVTYSPRGFGDSGGQIEVAGPDDMSDVSDVIDWMGAHTPAATDRVGIAGLSYGGGIALLAAAYEPRLASVVSMSTWTNLAAGYYPNNTRATTLALALITSAHLSGRPSPDADTAFTALLTGSDVDFAKRFGAQRSADQVLMRINAHRPAIMLAQELNDTAYSTSQITSFYDKLTGPKRLDLNPGDHATVSGGGYFGGPNPVWDDAYRWFAATLDARDTAILAEPPIHVVPRRPLQPDVVETYPTWQAATTRTTRYALGAPAGLVAPSGPLAPTPASPWSTRVTQGTNLIASNGSPMAGQFFIEAATHLPTTEFLPLIDRGHASVWHTEAAPSIQRLRGPAAMHLSVTPSAATGTVMAYLFDSEPTGSSILINSVPFSWSGAAAGVPMPVDLAIPDLAYDIPAGHQLSLVVTTDDPKYADENPPGAPMTFSSTVADPASLTVSFG